VVGVMWDRGEWVLTLVHCASKSFDSTSISLQIAQSPHTNIFYLLNYSQHKHNFIEHMTKMQINLVT